MSKQKVKDDYITRLPANQTEYWNSLSVKTRYKIASKFIEMLCRQMDESSKNVDDAHYTTLGCTRTKTFLSFTVCDAGQLTSGYEKDIAGVIRAVTSRLAGAYQGPMSPRIEEEMENMTEEQFEELVK